MFGAFHLAKTNGKNELCPAMKFIPLIPTRDKQYIYIYIIISKWKGLNPKKRNTQFSAPARLSAPHVFRQVWPQQSSRKSLGSGRLLIFFFRIHCLGLHTHTPWNELASDPLPRS